MSFRLALKGVTGLDELALSQMVGRQLPFFSVRGPVCSQRRPRLTVSFGLTLKSSFAKVIVVCEELVDESVIRADPNRTILPGLVVDAVVVEPFGAHPSYAQGYYDRDNAFYVEWDKISRDEESLQRWLAEWVYGLADRHEYVEKMGEERLMRLRPTPAPSGSVDYGEYR